MQVHHNGSGDNGQESLLDWARYYAEEFDLSIIRVIEGRKHPYKGEKYERWQKQRPDEEQLVQWFTDGQPSGIAVITGEVSGGLVCRDFDQAEDYRDWCDKHPALCYDLPTVETSRGFHVYARADLSNYHGPSYIKTAKHGMGEGELRLRNVLCVLPPSQHKSGTRYRWTREPDDGFPEVDLLEIGWLPPKVTQTTQTTQTTQRTHDIMSCVTSNISGNQKSRASDHEIERAIRACIPTKTGQRHDCIFGLARWLKKLMPAATLDELRPIVQRWHKLALPSIKTKAWEDSWFDFAETWGNVRYPKGTAPRDVVERAERATPPAICKSKGYSCEQTIRLVKLCRELHIAHNGQPFPLSCRIAAGVLGGSHKTLAIKLKGLCIDNVLKCVRKGKPGGKLASEYLYLGD